MSADEPREAKKTVEKAANETTEKSGFLSLKVGFWGLLAAAANLAVFGTFAGFFGRLYWFLDLFSPFRVQYALFLSVSAILFTVGRKYKHAIAFGVAALLNLALIIPIYFGGVPLAPAGKTPLRALLLNVHTANDNYAGVRDYLLAEDPDFMVLLEVSPRWWENLGALEQKYPYVDKHLCTDNFGLAVLSKRPWKSVESRSLCAAEVATVIAGFEFEGRELTIIATHPPPPVGGEYAGWRNEQLDNLAKLAAAQTGEVLLLGDLNLPPWSPYFAALLRDSGLRDSRRGFGIHPTWPSHLPIFYIPIDHCLVSKGVLVHGRRIGPALGSDHLPVVIDFTLAE